MADELFVTAGSEDIRKNQPDFSALFFAHFAKEEFADGIHYAVRHGPCFRHDLHFLDSLVHDAEFSRDDVIIKNVEVRIPLNRHRWEMREGHPERLATISSFLICRPVTSFDYRIQKNTSVRIRERHLMSPRGTSCLMIASLWVSREYWSDNATTFTFGISGTTRKGDQWEITLEMPVFESAIVLRDVQ